MKKEIYSCNKCAKSFTFYRTETNVIPICPCGSVEYSRIFGFQKVNEQPIQLETGELVKEFIQENKMSLDALKKEIMGE